jgi:hypothetical protein
MVEINRVKDIIGKMETGNGGGMLLPVSFCDAEPEVTPLPVMAGVAEVTWKVVPKWLEGLSLKEIACVGCKSRGNFEEPKPT